MGYKRTRKLEKRIAELEAIAKSNQIVLTSVENPETQVVIRLVGERLETIKRTTVVTETVLEYADLAENQETLLKTNKKSSKNEK